MARSARRFNRHVVAIVITWVTSICLIGSPTVSATKYGAGSYGRCQYETCAISLSSSSSIAVNVTPTASGTTCSVASDSVKVTTSSSTGYTLTLVSNTSSNVLAGSASSIPATSGTYANPVALTNGTWGYRVDGSGSFGAGPTSAQTNAAVPSLLFAAVQPNTGTADTILKTTSAASSGAITPVWYGVCVDASQTSGTYSATVLYTAVIN